MLRYNALFFFFCIMGFKIWTEIELNRGMMDIEDLC